MPRQRASTDAPLVVKMEMRFSRQALRYCLPRIFISSHNIEASRHCRRPCSARAYASLHIARYFSPYIIAAYHSRIGADIFRRYATIIVTPTLPFTTISRMIRHEAAARPLMQDVMQRACEPRHFARIESLRFIPADRRARSERRISRYALIAALAPNAATTSILRRCFDAFTRLREGRKRH